MDSDTLFNYFEEYNLDNNIIFLIFLSLLGIIIIINLLFILNYIYKKIYKNKIPMYIESDSKNQQSESIYIIAE